MKTLLNMFYATFWFCVACLVLLVAAFLVPHDSSFFRVAAYGLPGLLLGGLAYAACVGLLADKYGKSGAWRGTMALLFGPVSIVLSYVNMLRLPKSGLPATGSFLPKHTLAQKKWHWQLFAAFLVVFVVANVAVRFFK
jgi:hypothetical protein